MVTIAIVIQFMRHFLYLKCVRMAPLNDDYFHKVS